MERTAFLIVTKAVLADKRISTTAKVVLAQLMDHRNKTTGQCNPRETSLAEELGISRRTVLRALKELRCVGWIQAKRGQNGNRYEFPKCQNVTSQVTNWHLGSRASLYEPYLKKSAACRRATPQKKSAQREEVLARYYAKQRKAGN